MTDARLILVALKLIFVAFIYLFVWQVAKAVAAHVGAGIPSARSRPGSGLTIMRSEAQNGLRINVRQPVTLGRNEEADVVLKDPYAADYHVRLVNEDEGLSLFDLGSVTGTYVNGKRVSAPLHLNKGDAIQIGKTILEVT